MFSVVRHAIFAEWLRDLRDVRAVAQIAKRIDRLALGNPGDFKSVGDGVHEIRIDIGPGYRIYYIQRGQEIIILLCGGDKSTQTRDIKEAKRLAKTLR